MTISAAAFGLLFLQGNPVESVEESLTYTAAIGAADEQVEMYVYDAGNDEVEEAEEEASEMNAASSYAAKERILPAGEVEDTAELVDAYSSVPLFVSRYFPSSIYPAFSHFHMRFSTVPSAIYLFNTRINCLCGILSKNPFI